MSGIVRISRAFSRPLLLQTKKTCNHSKNLIRNKGTFVYRDDLPPVYSFNNKIAFSMGFLLTSWIGLNWYYNPGQVAGHFPDINPEEWTDEELGIPPDDEDIYPPGYIPLKDR